MKIKKLQGRKYNGKYIILDTRFSIKMEKKKGLYG